MTHVRVMVDPSGAGATWVQGPMFALVAGYCAGRAAPQPYEKLLAIGGIVCYDAIVQCYDGRCFSGGGVEPSLSLLA